MRESPIFVPHGVDRIAAVVTVPDGDVRGLVLMLAGTGLYEVIGSKLCTRAARRLAEQGFASVRMDYVGIGDSTGSVPQWSLYETAPTIAEVESVLRLVREAVGVSRFAVVGTCFGTRIALDLVRRGDCVGAVCLAAPLIDWGHWTSLGRRARAWPLVSFVRSNSLFRGAIISPLRRVFGEKHSTPQLDGAIAGTDHARILFLYSEGTRDHFDERVRRVLERKIAAIPVERQDRCRLRIVPFGPLTAFDVLSPEHQDAILDLVVDWVLNSFANVGDETAGSDEAADRMLATDEAYPNAVEVA